jgi:predicted ATPase
VSRASIRLLGAFAATIDGEPVAPRAWRLKKGRELVKLLALAPGHRLHREQVMDVLWREHAPAAAANNLYQAVHAARGALGPDAIGVHDEVVSLAEAIEVDVDAFGRAAADATRSGTAGAYRAALALYSGPLLPENRYDDWAEEPRERLESIRADLTARLDASDEAGGGLRGLPAETSSFVGRGHELGELRSLLSRTRLLTLAGTGGAGKTRLAFELARSEQHAFTDGVALVELAAVSDAPGVPIAVAAAMDVRALPDERLVDAICAFLAERTVLVVLDNCEHVIGASAELVDAVLRAAPNVTVLTTSREPLRLTGEVVFRVPSLTIPNPELELPPDELLRYESVRLFADRAASVAPGFAIDERNAAHVTHICFRLDGLPLALELASGRLGALGVETISERLDDRFRLLQAGSRAAPTRQQTLLATLHWSHDLLDDEERLLFRRLAVFAGGFTLDAAEIVCADEAFASVDVADVLAQLVEKSLVTAGDGSGDWRYSLLETVREYARDRLDESGETDAIERRHASWATELAERERDSPRLDAEAANLRRALTTLLETDPEQALRFCVAVWPFWLRRIDLTEARRRFATVLAAAPERTSLRVEGLRASAAIDFRAGTLTNGFEQAMEAHAIASELGDARAEWRTLQFLGEFSVASDAGASAWEWAERGLEFAREHGLAPAEALCVYTLGVSRWMVGDLERADELLAESLERFRAVDADELIPSPVNISETRVWGDDNSTPLGVVFEDTLQPFFEVSCASAVGFVLANLATIARLRGDIDRADRLLTEGRTQFTELGDERGQASVLARRGYFELELGDIDEARALLEQSLEIRRGLHERRGVGLSLSGLGLVETMAGDYERAELRLVEAREIFRRAGDRWGLTNALWRTAELARARGNLDEAWTALKEARDVVDVTQRRRWLGHTDAALAEVAALRGERALALDLFASAREQYAEAQDADGIAAVDQRLAGLA